MQRRRSIAACVVALAVISAGCTDRGSAPAGSGTAAAPQPTGTLWTPREAPPATVVVQSALPTPVPVPGENLDLGERTTPMWSRYGGISVTLPEDFGQRQDLAICSWSEEGGWASCAGLRPPPEASTVDRPSGSGDAAIYLVLERDAETARRPLRRLLVSDREHLGQKYRLRSEYVTVADVLTMQPGSDGSYLEVDE